MGLLGETDFVWGNVDSCRGSADLAEKMDAVSLSENNHLIQSLTRSRALSRVVRLKVTAVRDFMLTFSQKAEKTMKACCVHNTA